MQYRHLYYFVKIVEAGSFSQAARTIHVAQPALSHQIAELEASLGMALLKRSAETDPTAGQWTYLAGSLQGGRRWPCGSAGGPLGGDR